MTTDNVTRAACLTPPGPGGIAIVQVWGPRASDLVAFHLRPLRNDSTGNFLHRLGPEQIRLCRLVDGDETLDEILVCVRAHGTETVVDLNLHGGPRVVQRVLRALRDAGALIVNGMERASGAWPSCNAVEAEALELLPRTATRDVAAWLLRAKDRLTSALENCLALIDSGEIELVRARLSELIAHPHLPKQLVDGVRIVIAGRPNAGKSTLTNALARREHALVSDVPGTTRDYVEQAASIDGVPATLVDTAGIRLTDDPLEAEAIARSHGQLENADFILHVIDSTTEQPAQEEAADDFMSKGPGSPAGKPSLLVWNKADLPPHPSRRGRPGMSAVNARRVSAATGDGMPELEEAILAALDLAGWKDRWPVAFTLRQRQLLKAARDELAAGHLYADRAKGFIVQCLSGPRERSDAPASALI